MSGRMGPLKVIRDRGQDRTRPSPFRDVAARPTTPVTRGLPPVARGRARAGALHAARFQITDELILSTALDRAISEEERLERWLEFISRRVEAQVVKSFLHRMALEDRDHGRILRRHRADLDTNADVAEITRRSLPTHIEIRGEMGYYRAVLTAVQMKADGMSGLIPGPGGWAAVSGEGGHVAFAPTDDQQIAVLRRLRGKFGRVSLERVLSGPGLLNLYTALAEIGGLPPTLDTPEAVTAAGAPDPASAAQAMFSTILGTAAGDLALTLGAFGGVYVAGGIIAAMGTCFDSGAFRAAFTDKGRFQKTLIETPTYLITGPNPALVGLSALINSATRSI